MNLFKSPLKACINGVIDEFIVLNVTLPPETITKLSESLQPATVITGSEIHMYDPGFGRTRLSANGLFMADDGGGGVFAALNGSTAVSWV